MEQEIKPGQVWTDSLFDSEYEVKYVDDGVVLLMDTESGHYHLYDRDDFTVASERTLVQQQNRFTLKDDDSKE